MKKTISIIGLALVGSSFGLDEYLSIEKGKFEVDAGYSLTMPTGFFDSESDKKDYPNGVDPLAHGIPLQLKYGIIEGLDAELAITGISTNEDFGDLGGFSQPELAVKYTVANLGLGGFVNVVLPFVTGNLDIQEPALGLGLGAVYQNRFGDFRLTGIAGYQLNFENEDKFQNGNILLAYAKPEAMWTEYIGTYLGIKYLLAGEDQFDGTSLKDSDGNQVVLLPGVNVQLTKSLAYEINVPFNALGKNADAGWGINANFYATLPLSN